MRDISEFSRDLIRDNRNEETTENYDVEDSSY